MADALAATAASPLQRHQGPHVSPARHAGPGATYSGQPSLEPRIAFERTFRSSSRIINPVVYGDCFTKTSSDIASLLTCAMLTPDQTNTLETCFDMLDAQACTTQAEADAQAMASASGERPTSQGLPAACAVVMNLPAGYH